MLICQVCGAEFEGRWGSQTCSDKCRKRLSRSVQGRSKLPPLAVVGPDGKPPVVARRDPLTVTEAVSGGDYADVVSAVRLRVAAALDSDRTPPSAMAGLARVMSELSSEVERLSSYEEEKLAGLGVVDVPFDATMI